MAFILLIWAVWAMGAVVWARRSLRQHGLARWLGLLASGLLLLGATGFLGAGFSSEGGLDWLPSSFEWPVGSVEGVVKTKDGFHVVPHTPSGRVQIYDSEWHFIRGWHVDAGGGVFKLDVTADGAIDVFTARGDWHYVFTTDGQLVSKEKYSPPDLYSSLPERGEHADVPTAPWLWTFSSPTLSWIVGVCGMFLGWLAERTAQQCAPRDSWLPSAQRTAPISAQKDMRRVSGSTVYAKVVFPTLWLGCIAFVVLSSMWSQNMGPALVVPFAMAAFGFVLFKRMAWDLIDVVYDCGDHLVFRKRNVEQHVGFQDVINVNYSHASPPRVTVSARSVGPLGKELSFIPEMHGSMFGFSRPAIVGELVERADQARRRE